MGGALAHLCVLDLCDLRGALAGVLGLEAEEVERLIASGVCS